MLKIYLINADNIEIDDSYFLNVPEKKLKRVTKSSNEEFIKEQLGSQKLLNQILEKKYNLDLSKLEYIYNEFGKPYLKDVNLYFSIAHSKGMIAVGVADEEFGIDIEKVIDIPLILIKKTLTDLEFAEYESLNEEEKHEYFFKIWTKKEAIVKKKGTSITFRPSNIKIDEDIYTTRISMNDNIYILSSTIKDVELIIKEKL